MKVPWGHYNSFLEEWPGHQRSWDLHALDSHQYHSILEFHDKPRLAGSMWKRKTRGHLACKRGHTSMVVGLSDQMGNVWEKHPHLKLLTVPAHLHSMIVPSPPNSPSCVCLPKPHDGLGQDPPGFFTHHLHNSGKQRGQSDFPPPGISHRAWNRRGPPINSCERLLSSLGPGRGWESGRLTENVLDISTK